VDPVLKAGENPGLPYDEMKERRWVLIKSAHLFEEDLTWMEVESPILEES